ncbi:MAG: hypothetical protein ACEPO8_05630 [Rhodothermaceae bacterium]
MKKFLLVSILILTGVVSAQYNSGAIKLGVFNPASTDAGFMIGYEGGWKIDKSLTLGWSVDWFHKEYVDQNLVKEYSKYYGVSDYTVHEVRAKTNLHDIPVMFNATARFPVNRRTAAYLYGAIGAEILIINYRDFHRPDNDETTWAFGLGWRLGGGISYKLGRRSELFGEVVYHNAEPSWEYEVGENPLEIPSGKRTFVRKHDMSGLIIRGGLRFYY